MESESADRETVAGATARDPGAVRDAAPCWTVTTASPEETAWLGAMLGRLLQPSDLVLLQGPLGAGKTCLTQGIARGFGFEGRVSSPSFTLANVYEPEPGGCPLYHLDLWRIKSPVEALGLGLDEYLAGAGPCVIEWPEIADGVMPGAYLRVRIEPTGSKGEAEAEHRRIEICAVGARPEALLDALRAARSARADAGGSVAPGD